MIRDAAAVILLRHNTDASDPEVFLVRRSTKLSFLGGYHAFPGGQFDETDSDAPVENCADSETSTAISCAARELFEETGVLVARGGDALTQGQRASLLDDLQSQRMTWPALLRHYNLHLDANDFTFVGRWVTPPFSARRFDTWFFLINCPAKQRAEVAVDGELDHGDWIPASDALGRWQRSEVLAVPPVIHALKTLVRRNQRRPGRAFSVHSQCTSRAGTPHRVSAKLHLLSRCVRPRSPLRRIPTAI